MRPPKLKSTCKHKIYDGILDGIPSSPQLASLDLLGIFQIVFFKGEMFAMDDLDGLYTIFFAPRLNIHEVEIVWTEYQREDNVEGHYVNVMYWLVVCGDMFLNVDLSTSYDRSSAFFRVFRLDFSTIPAKWVKVENLGNHAIFVSLGQRNPAFAA